MLETGIVCCAVEILRQRKTDSATEAPHKPLTGGKSERAASSFPGDDKWGTSPLLLG
jgi:hypothetical protein